MIIRAYPMTNILEQKSGRKEQYTLLSYLHSPASVQERLIFEPVEDIGKRQLRMDESLQELEVAIWGGNRASRVGADLYGRNAKL
jgi:hypothetical protein